MGTPVYSLSVRTCNCSLAWGWPGGTEPRNLCGLTLTAGGGGVTVGLNPGHPVGVVGLENWVLSEKTLPTLKQKGFRRKRSHSPWDSHQ